MDKDFREQQYAFAAHLRNPDTHPAPAGVEDRRMNIYRELFFNNIQSLLAKTFPVLHRILGTARWARLVRAFYHRHISHTPLFMEVPKEFLAWLEEGFENDGHWPDFMRELAHYEWVELDVSIDPREIDFVNVKRDGSLLEGVPVLSPVARLLCCQYPVHRIGPDFQPASPGDAVTFLVVYRKRDDEVGFMEINAVTARLLGHIQENPQGTGHEHLARIAEELDHPDPGIVIKGGLETLEMLREQDIIPGVR